MHYLVRLAQFLVQSAIEKINGVKFWFKNGKLHREDGPAMLHYIYYNYNYWYYHGEFITDESQEKFERLIKLKAFW